MHLYLPVPYIGFLLQLTFNCPFSVIYHKTIIIYFNYRGYATQITSDVNNSDVYSSTICMLQKLEDNASSIVQKVMDCLAQVCFDICVYDNLFRRKSTFVHSKLSI